jgi:hypothetical protein
LCNDLILVRIAEVVGSNPTRSIFISLVNYGIELGLFLVNVGRKPYSNALREKLDDKMFDIPRLYIRLLLYAVQPVGLYPILMSILLHDYKQLTECISEVERI